MTGGLNLDEFNVTLPTPHGDLVLKNPIMPAAGTFGYAIDNEKAMDLSCLGAIVPNSMAITEGQPSTARRFYQSDYGFISSFGANNISYKTFIHEILPRLPYETTPVFIDIKAYDLKELTEFVAILSEVKELAGMEINLNCPYGNFAVPSYWKDMEQLKEMVQKVKPRREIKFSGLRLRPRNIRCSRSFPWYRIMAEMPLSALTQSADMP